jgi:hypothetical protein
VRRVGKKERKKKSRPEYRNRLHGLVSMQKAVINKNYLGEHTPLEHEIKIYRHSTKISRIAAELYEATPPDKIEEAFSATKELMGNMKLHSQLREEKLKLARERVRNGYYNRKDVMAKIASEILKEFDLE